MYIDRLVNDWIKYDKIVLAIDYDSTVYYHEHFPNFRDVLRARTLIRKAQKLGTHNAIFTASEPERHTEILKICARLGINVDAINKNPIDLPFGNNGSKIFYNINLCDRCGLIEALDILEIAMENVKNVREVSQLILD